MPQDSELGVIRDGDILAVVCDQHSWTRGVEIKHLLIAKWIDGRLHFYHASEKGLGLSDMDAYTYMKDKFTMMGLSDMDAYTYMKDKFTMMGVTVYRLKYDAA